MIGRWRRRSRIVRAFRAAFPEAKVTATRDLSTVTVTYSRKAPNA